MHENVRNSVQNLVNRVCHHRQGAGLNLVPRFYELLLNYDGSLVDVDIDTIICYIRLIRGENNLADVLERLIAEAERLAKNADDMRNVIRFFSCINDLSESSSNRQPFMDVHFLKPTLATLNCHAKILKLEPSLPFDVFSMGKNLCTEDFPILPNVNQTKDLDEGFEEGFSSQAVAKRKNEICQTTTNEDKSENRCPVWKNRKILSKQEFARDQPQPSSVYLSEAGDEIFQEFYLHNMVRPVNSILHSRGEAKKFFEFTFDYLKRNVRNVLLGVETNLFPFDTDTNSFFFLPRSTLIGLSVESFLDGSKSIVQIGTQFRRILTWLQRDVCERSAMLRTFYFSLRRELETIEKNIDNACFRAKGIVELCENLKPIYESVLYLNDLMCAFHEKTARSNSNTVVVWLIDVLFELCTSFCFSSRNSFYRRIFAHVFSLYLTYVDSWIVSGKIESPIDFFVHLNEQYLTSRDATFWKHAFTLNEHCVPACMKNLSASIFNAGKLTNLMNFNSMTSRNEVADFRSSFDVNNYTLFRRHDFEDSDKIFTDDCFASSLSFEKYLRDRYSPKISTVEEQSLKFLLNDCKLLDTLKYLREIYLGANGFFTTSISETLFPLFYKIITTEIESGSLCPLILTRALDECIDTSGLRKNLLLPISFRVNDETNEIELSNVNFFNILELHCEIPWPCNLVVTNSVLNWLKKLFRFLLSIRWTIWSLSEVWNYLKSSESETCFIDRHKLMLCQRDMKHFIQQLETYVLHQTVDVCWCDFLKTFANVRNFDALITSHNNYVNAVVTRCLLNPKAQPVYDCIRRLLECALMFRCRIIIDENEKKAFNLYEEFNVRARALISVVDKLASRGYQSHLSELLLRLNFNEFYFKS